MKSETAETSAGGLLQGDVLVVCWLHNVASKLELRSLGSGAVRQEIPLPGKGALRGFSGRREDNEMFFSYSSFTDPGSIFRWTPVRIRAESSCGILILCSINVWFCTRAALSNPLSGQSGQAAGLLDGQSASDASRSWKD